MHACACVCRMIVSGNSLTFLFEDLNSSSSSNSSNSSSNNKKPFSYIPLFFLDIFFSVHSKRLRTYVSTDLTHSSTAQHCLNFLFVNVNINLSCRRILDSGFKKHPVLYYSYADDSQLLKSAPSHQIPTSSSLCRKLLTALKRG